MATVAGPEPTWADGVSVVGFFATEQAANEESVRQRNAGFRSFVRPVLAANGDDPPWEYQIAIYVGGLGVIGPRHLQPGDDAEVLFRRYQPTPEELAHRDALNAQVAAHNRTAMS